MGEREGDGFRALKRKSRVWTPVIVYGRVASLRGLMIEVAGPVHAMHVGGLVDLEVAPGRTVSTEVVGFSGDRALVMPFGTVDGIRRGCGPSFEPRPAACAPTEKWLGRVINAQANPLTERVRCRPVLA